MYWKPMTLVPIDNREYSVVFHGYRKYGKYLDGVGAFSIVLGMYPRSYLAELNRFIKYYLRVVKVHNRSVILNHVHLFDAWDLIDRNFF